MIHTTQCCALGEYDGTTYDSIKYMVREVKDYVESVRARAFILFTFASANKKAAAFCNFVEKNGLGTIVRTKPKKNPNTGRHVICVIWALNIKNLRKFKV